MYNIKFKQQLSQLQNNVKARLPNTYMYLVYDGIWYGQFNSYCGSCNYNTIYASIFL